MFSKLSALYLALLFAASVSAVGARHRLPRGIFGVALDDAESLTDEAIVDTKKAADTGFNDISGFSEPVF